jgi:hypothetical protein
VRVNQKPTTWLFQSGRREDGTERATLDASGTTATAAGVDSRWLVPIDADDGLEPALSGGHTFATGLAKLVIDPRRNDGAQAVHHWHKLFHSALLWDAGQRFHYGTVAADHRTQAATIAAFLVNDRRCVGIRPFNHLAQTAHLKVTRNAAFTSFRVNF